ncbi:MAG: exo-alpha-sialidase [Clostridia bacterium]|nr:exo-alpha-sialidase [Clostridia bacterium]
MKKVIAAVLCLTMLFSTQALACKDEGSNMSQSVFISVIADFFERFISVFKGSTNEKSDIQYTAETGQLFENKKHFKSSHASTIVKMNDGRLMSAYFAGTGEGYDDVRIWFSVYENGTWSIPSQVPSEDTVAHWNPVLTNYGDFIRLYYKVGEEIPYWVTKYTDTYDGGKTWTEPKELVAGDTSGGRGPVRNKIFVTADGTLIAGASTEQGQWRAFFDISVDGGNTWEKTDYIVAKGVNKKDIGMIQPTIWQDNNGVVHAMFRTDCGRIYRSDSVDGGKTWCEAYSTGLMNNYSGIDCVMTDDGRLWLVHTPAGMKVRNRLILSVSEDNGKTWKDVMTLEESKLNLSAEYSYPAIIAEGNRLYITYTHSRKTINYAFIEYQE